MMGERRASEVPLSQIERELYTHRFATVEPVFGNLRANKGLDRITQRGRGAVLRRAARRSESIQR